MIFVCFPFVIRPETKTYLARVEQQRQEKLRGNKQDNRSFLAKYVNMLSLIKLIISYF